MIFLYPIYVSFVVAIYFPDLIDMDIEQQKMFKEFYGGCPYDIPKPDNSLNDLFDDSDSELYYLMKCFTPSSNIVDQDLLIVLPKTKEELEKEEQQIDDVLEYLKACIESK